jgi:hypothetical protein
MTDNPTARAIGTALIVSEDAVATRQIAEAMQELALSVEVCNKVSDAMDRVNHSKLEVAVIDFSLGTQATRFLEQLRGSASNRTAVAFAITGSWFEFCAGKTPNLRFAPQYPPSRLRNDCARASSLLPISHLRSGSRQQERGIGNLRGNGERQRKRRCIQWVNSAGTRC